MLKLAQRLKKLGMEPLLAEGHAEALSEVFEANLNEVATKADLKRLQDHLEERFDTKLAELKFEMLKWVIGLSLAQFALLVGILIKLLLLSH